MRQRPHTARTGTYSQRTQKEKKTKNPKEKETRTLFGRFGRLVDATEPRRERCRSHAFYTFATRIHFENRKRRRRRRRRRKKEGTDASRPLGQFERLSQRRSPRLWWWRTYTTKQARFRISPRSPATRNERCLGEEKVKVPRVGSFDWSFAVGRPHSTVKLVSGSSSSSSSGNTQRCPDRRARIGPRAHSLQSGCRPAGRPTAAASPFWKSPVVVPIVKSSGSRVSSALRFYGDCRWDVTCW